MESLGEFVEVGAEGSIPENTGIVANVKDKMIAVFFAEGKYFATQNNCVHKGGFLGEGMIENGAVICPLHGWQYELNTGNCINMPNVQIQVFPTKVEGGKVWVEV